MTPTWLRSMLGSGGSRSRPTTSTGRRTTSANGSASTPIRGTAASRYVSQLDNNCSFSHVAFWSFLAQRRSRKNDLRISHSPFDQKFQKCECGESHAFSPLPFNSRFFVSAFFSIFVKSQSRVISAISCCGAKPKVCEKGGLKPGGSIEVSLIEIEEICQR